MIDVGAHVATPRTADAEENEKKLNHTQFDEENALTLEAWIDSMDDKLPPLRNFILPGGGLTAA